MSKSVFVYVFVSPLLGFLERLTICSWQVVQIQVRAGHPLNQALVLVPLWDRVLVQTFRTSPGRWIRFWSDPWRRPEVTDSAWQKVLSSGGALFSSLHEMLKSDSHALPAQVRKTRAFLIP